MLTLSFSIFLASILTWIPGAASSHSGLAGASNGGTNGSRGRFAGDSVREPAP